MKNNYYIGLDVGTDSIGWAVTNEEYDLLKFNGNAQWGIRLLEESNTAEERRSFRASRRRNERAKFRLKCLEMLFDREITKVDPSFFERLKESNLYEEDKNVDGKYSLFFDENYNDKDYHKQYPTIYHLREKLICSSEKIDIRLLYLAIAHIIKNRGHFLFENDSLGDGARPDFERIWNDVSAYASDSFGIALDCKDIAELKSVLSNDNLSITAKKTKLNELFSLAKTSKQEIAIMTLLAGGTTKISAVFGNEAYNDIEKTSISFSSGYEDNAQIFESSIGENFEFIERLKAVYDWAILTNILGENNTYISSAKVNVYEQHKKDLQTLKEFINRYCRNKKKMILDANDIPCNYAAYSRHTSKGVIEKECHDQKEFNDFLKKQLNNYDYDDKFKDMFDRIELGTFMPKLRVKDNSVIPMQINKAELQAILTNACQNYPFLNEKDESNKTISEKIMDIFMFRVPYYVGPLNKHSDKAWVERKEGKIYPWNFNEVVDTEKSAENFINNLTSKCTYIKSANVLPKYSLTYSKFTVLNELNNLCINGQKITVELKQKIYDDLFLRNNKVTQKKLKDYLLTTQGIKDPEISGIDGDFKNSLKTIRDLKEYNLSDSEKEKLINIITIFGDDKRLLKKRIERDFGKKISNEEITKICKLKYKEWGHLSEEFLCKIQGVCKETGEINSIIGFMWDTNNNLMQLLSDKYSFSEVIEEINGEMSFTSLKKEVDNLYVSPKVKRPIYQTMKIVSELVKINGCEPKKIFVEVARGAEEKKRTVSRKARLLDLYKSCKKDNEALFEQLNSKDEDDFRQDALYLYFTQFGKCMYSGESINIEDITNKNIYDIDHIFPQSKIKDDSIDNRVLVKKVINEEKGNIYPIKKDIQEKMASYWKMLLDKELISKKKYERLVRATPLTDDELYAFISRQLVETRQSTKAIAQLLSKKYSSEIVYVKAGLVSDFRDRYKFVKCREVNDLHHAKDAYLNIVVGNVYNTRFNHNKMIYIDKLQRGEISMNRIFDYSTKGAWDAANDASISKVSAVMRKNNIRFTRYASKQTGGLFDIQPLRKGNGQVSLKKNSPRADIEKYGGYNGAKSTYFAYAEYFDKKDNLVKAFVPVDLYNEHEYLADKNKYIEKQLQTMGDEAKQVNVIIPCVKYNSLISVDGFRMHISSKSSGGKTLVCKSSMQLVLTPKNEVYVKKVANYIKKCQELKKEKTITKYDAITKEENTDLYKEIVYKLTSTILKLKLKKTGDFLVEKSEKFNELSISQQCIVLNELMVILHSDVRPGNLELLGGAKKSGILTMGNKIPSDSNVKLINQSITGLFETEKAL